MSAVLLDTCAIIFIAEDQAILPLARRAVSAATVGEGILVSPISAWEIGLLAVRRRIAVLPDPRAWFLSFLANAGVRLTPLTPEIAIDSAFLPAAPRLPSDPADRLLIATARALGVPIVTRDQRILDYGQFGSVAIIPC